MGKGFSECNGKPILISNEVCDTLCDPLSIKSLVARREPRVIPHVYTSLITCGSVTEKNCKKFVELLTRHNRDPVKVLVIGSGSRGHGTGELYACKQIEITGIDVYDSHDVDVIADAHYLPFSAGSFDGVWIQAVLEHVVEPALVVSEIHRVLKCNGLIYAETPFMQQVHEGAYDFTRFTVLGHRYLFRDFSLIDCGGNKGPDVVLTWSVRYYIHAITRSRLIAMAVATICALVLRPFSGLVDRRFLYDASSGVYFLGRKGNSRLRHAELSELYMGAQT